MKITPILFSTIIYSSTASGRSGKIRGSISAAVDNNKEVADANVATFIETGNLFENLIESESSSNIPFVSFGFANCHTKTECTKYGRNSCDTIYKDCDQQCKWNDSKDLCDYNTKNHKPTKKPTKKPIKKPTKKPTPRPSMPSPTRTTCTLYPPFGTGDSDPYCGHGSYCSIPTNECRYGGPVTGVCKPISTRVCGRPIESEKVCGCDGKTYPSECDANQAGVSISDIGECPGPRPGDYCYLDAPFKDEPYLSDPYCGRDSYCSLKDNECRKSHNSSGARGTCRKKPEVCNDQYKPVCGCDGKTYTNKCVAQQAGISVSDIRECKK